MIQDEIKNMLLLLQINDSLFPIGSYSHSFGLETYIQKGLVKDINTASDYIEKRMLYGLAYTELLAVRLAYEAAAENNTYELNELEEKLEASIIPMEMREASAKLGSRFIKTLLHMDAPKTNGIFSKYTQQRKGKTSSHACAYGVFCADAGILIKDALLYYLYSQVSAMITNCVKTVPLSQSAGQKLLYALQPVCEQVIAITAQAGADMLCLSAPGFDLRSIQHESLYSRLYMS